MRIPFYFIACLIILLVGCKTDSSHLKEITEDDLYGEWVIYYATRNGKVTKSLENGNFVFQADKLVSSNLFSTTNNLNFIYDKGTIEIKGEPNFGRLVIEHLQNDTLIFSSKLKVFEMEFFLTKK